MTDAYVVVDLEMTGLNPKTGKDYRYLSAYGKSQDGAAGRDRETDRYYR